MEELSDLNHRLAHRHALLIVRLCRRSDTCSTWRILTGLIAVRKDRSADELASRGPGRLPRCSRIRPCRLSVVSSFSKACDADESVELAVNCRFRR